MGKTELTLQVGLPLPLCFLHLPMPHTTLGAPLPNLLGGHGWRARRSWQVLTSCIWAATPTSHPPTKQVVTPRGRGEQWSVWPLF